MKIILFFLSIFSLPLLAELSPSAYLASQKTAPEVTAPW
ncbi:MAG: hypothetical protein ACJAQT_000640 [Akkermansiaceae bacterium]|jgi:hypothetical protein